MPHYFLWLCGICVTSLRVQGRPLLLLLLQLNLLIESIIFWVITDQNLFTVLIRNTKIELGIVSRVT